MPLSQSRTVPIAPGSRLAFAACLFLGVACSASADDVPEVASADAITTSTSEGENEQQVTPTSLGVALNEDFALVVLPPECTVRKVDRTQLPRIGVRFSGASDSFLGQSTILENLAGYLDHHQKTADVVRLDASVPIPPEELDQLTIIVDHNIGFESDNSLLDAAIEGCTPVIGVGGKGPYVNNDSPWVLPNPGMTDTAQTTQLLATAAALNHQNAAVISRPGDETLGELLHETDPSIHYLPTPNPADPGVFRPITPDTIDRLIELDPDLVIIDVLCESHRDQLSKAGVTSALWFPWPACNEMTFPPVATPESKSICHYLVGGVILDPSVTSDFTDEAEPLLETFGQPPWVAYLGWSYGWYIEQLLQPIDNQISNQTVLTRSRNFDHVHPHTGSHLQTSKEDRDLQEDLFWHIPTDQSWTQIEPSQSCE
ncbi:MAG: hypothetical protein AAGA65_17950 [Actinomycetota bacterium]